MNPIIEQARNQGRLFLTEIESKKLLGQAGINCNLTELAISEAETISLSKRLGFPVSLKIASPDIIHKNDDGGVRLGLETPEQVKTAYNEILKKSAKKIYRHKYTGFPCRKWHLPVLL